MWVIHFSFCTTTTLSSCHALDIVIMKNCHWCKLTLWAYPSGSIPLIHQALWFRWDLRSGAGKFWPAGQIQPATLIHLCVVAAFMLRWQSWVVSTENTWPTKPKYYYLALYKRVCSPALDCCLSPFFDPLASLCLHFLSSLVLVQGLSIQPFFWQCLHVPLSLHEFNC